MSLVRTLADWNYLCLIYPVITLFIINYQDLKGNTMAKACTRCGKKITLLNKPSISKMKDGSICIDCYRDSGLAKLVTTNQNDAGAIALSLKNVSVDSLETYIDAYNNILKQKDSMIKEFVPTYEVPPFAAFDDAHQTMRGTSNIGLTKSKQWFLPYSAITGYEIIESDVSTTKGTTLAPAIGASLFGASGAVIGASSSNRKIENKCNMMKFMVYNTTGASTFISLITGEFGRTSKVYSSAKSTAANIATKLDGILNHNTNITSERTLNDSNDKIIDGDALRELKTLLDEGIISEDDYNIKKAKILGI